MSSHIKLLFTTLGLTLLFLHTSIHARPIDPIKRELIDQIIEHTGTAKVLPLMTKQLTNEILKLLHNKGVNIDNSLVKLVQEEANIVMYEEFVLSNQFNEIFYQIYDEYFTVNQLNTIVAFYDSSAGSRLLKLMPDISRRSMKLAQEHSKGVGLKVQQRLMKRFDEAEKIQQTKQADSAN